MTQRIKRVAVMEGLPRKDKFIKGFVDIQGIRRDGTIETFGKSNRIVYTAREWLLPAIFRLDNNNLGLPTGHYNWGIWWISVGDCSPSDPANPPAAQDTDTGLVGEHVIGTESIYADMGRKKRFDSVQFLGDSANNNKYLIVQTTTTFEFNEINGGSTTPINEAALWISDSDDPSQATAFRLFARTTFPTINKDANLKLQFLWYIYS